METKSTDTIKAVAFDLGKVLFDFDYQIALDRIKDKITIPPQSVIDALFEENFADDFERGFITPGDFYLKFREKTGFSSDYQEFVDVWCDIFTPMKETWALVESLRPFYTTLLISNINELHYHFLKQRFPYVFSLFSDEILSFAVKEMKPAPRIYDILLEKAGVAREQLVYIDDRADLIAGARAQGLNCIRFEQLGQCRRALKGFGLRLA
ncbi:HAD family hydrolase [Candidatus Omnitrophota bacterium]